MSRFIPESANRKDWPRLVARTINDMIRNQGSATSGSSAFDMGDSGPEGGAAMDLGNSA